MAESNGFTGPGAHITLAEWGGSGTENPEGIYVSSEGDVFFTGDTQSTNFPMTACALQAQNGGGGPGDYGAGDNILVKLSPTSTVSLDPSKTYQTLTGWEAVAFALGPMN